MTAGIATHELRAVVGWAARAVPLPSRASVPVMTCIGLRVADGQASAHAWDYEVLTEATAEAAGDLEVTHVPGRTLADAVARLEADEATLHLQDGRLVLASGRRRFDLPAARPGTYPSLPSRPEPVGVTSDLAALVRRVAPSAAEWGSVPADLLVLSAVTLSATDGQLTATATNRYMLSRTHCAWDGDDFTINIPAQALAALVPHLEDKVTIGVGTRATLDDGTRHASLCLIDTKPVDVESLFATAPGGNAGGDAAQVDVDRADLIDAVKAVTPTVAQHEPVHLRISGDQIIVTAAADHLGRSQATVEAELDGQPRDVAYSPDYLTRALTGTPGETVRIHLATNGHRPCLITGVDPDGRADLTTRHLVMPVIKRGA